MRRFRDMCSRGNVRLRRLSRSSLILRRVRAFRLSKPQVAASAEAFATNAIEAANWLAPTLSEVIFPFCARNPHDGRIVTETGRHRGYRDCRLSARLPPARHQRRQRRIPHHLGQRLSPPSSTGRGTRWGPLRHRCAPQTTRTGASAAATYSAVFIATSLDGATVALLAAEQC